MVATSMLLVVQIWRRRSSIDYQVCVRKVGVLFWAYVVQSSSWISEPLAVCSAPLPTRLINMKGRWVVSAVHDVVNGQSVQSMNMMVNVCCLKYLTVPCCVLVANARQPSTPAAWALL